MAVDALFIMDPDFCAGMRWNEGGCDVVPGFDDRSGARVDIDSKSLLRRQDDYSEYGVGGSKPRRIDESVEPERFDRVAFRAPTDPYAGFAFGLDSATHGEPLVATELEYPPALETLHHLGCVMQPPTGVDTTVDLISMDLDETLSKPTPSSSTPLPPSPPLSPTVGVSTTRSLISTDLVLCLLLDSHIKVMPETTQISATVSGSGRMFECPETTSVLMNLDLVQEEVIAGPRLFQFLDDNDME